MSQFLSFSIRDLGRHRAAAAVALLPVVLPTVYIAYLHWAVRRTTTRTSGQLPPHQATTTTTTAAVPRTPKSLPADVAAQPSDWVICYERVVSHPLPAAALVHKLRGRCSDSTSPSPLLAAYLRTTFKAFSWTPQAFMLRAMVAEPALKASFAAAHIDGLKFADGDLVDGVYRVMSYDGSEAAEAVELSIDVPRAYRGRPVRGLIMAAVEEREGEVRFVNETWMWRRKGDKATMLESGLGRWFHGLLAGWLVMKGLGGVTHK